MWAAPSGHPSASGSPPYWRGDRRTGVQPARRLHDVRRECGRSRRTAGARQDPSRGLHLPSGGRLAIFGSTLTGPGRVLGPSRTTPFLPHHETGLARGASGTTHVRLRRVRAAGSAGGAFTALSREPRQRRGHLLEPPRRGGPIHRQGHAPLHVHRAASAGGYTFWLNSMSRKAVAGASVNVSALERIAAIAGGSPRRLAELLRPRHAGRRGPPPEVPAMT